MPALSAMRAETGMPWTSRVPEAAASGRRTPKASDDTLMLPSALKDAQGQPRFVMPIPRIDLADSAIRFLVERETKYGGYEYPTRAFFDAHLQPGDLFIDVGAHWGIMALTAATRAPGEIACLAVEAHPLNAMRLMAAVRHNKLHRMIDVVAAAAGDAPGTAPLVTNSTMGHSLYGLGLKGYAQGDFPLSVPVVSLDMLLAERPALQNRRTFIKIDVEGFEPQVIAGARALLESGNVAAVVWEKGHAFDDEPGRSAMEAMVAELEALGFTSYVLPSHDLGGPLLPFVAGQGSCNVFSLAADLVPERAYLRPAGPIPPLSRSNRGSADPAQRRALTAALAAVGGSDGTRWSDPEQLRQGADERAAAAARHVRTGAQVLDVGAGLMRLARALPEGCAYRPLDLVPFARNTLVCDLNQGPIPKGRADVVAALELLEFIHDLPSLLTRCAETAPRLLCTYRCRGDESTAQRRSQGWFSDHTEAAFRALLRDAGWQVETSEPVAGTTLFVCRRG